LILERRSLDGGRNRFLTLLRQGFRGLRARSRSHLVESLLVLLRLLNLPATLDIPASPRSKAKGRSGADKRLSGLLERALEVGGQVILLEDLAGCGLSGLASEDLRHGLE